MIFSLVNECGVQEFHPIMDNCCDDMSVEEMDRQVEQMVKSTDNIFKKETQCANYKCDENYKNDGNGGVAELNDDENETTQNQNSDLSDYLMERSMIKITDNIMCRWKKYETETNENETDKIKERPVDDTIEEKYK